VASEMLIDFGKVCAALTGILVFFQTKAFSSILFYAAAKTSK
jgi:hypothetical protein